MRFVLFILLLFVSASAQNIFSNIPPVRIEVVNLNPALCDEDCLGDLRDKRRVFSFVARFDRSVNDVDLHRTMEEYSRQIGTYYKIRVNPLGDESLKVALLMPKKVIGKYSTTTIDTILAYLFSRDLNFKFKMFDSVDEEIDSLLNAVNQINSGDFDFLIAIVSQKDSIEALRGVKIPVYIPTMSSEESYANITFGGIDYNAQMAKLVAQKTDGVTIVYNDDSALGQSLGAITLAHNDFVIKEEIITSKIAANFSKNIESQEMFLAGSNVFLNTPVVKSGLLLSQIALSTQQPAKILSTQVNYNPALLSLIRGNNTQNIIIANSISDINPTLLEYGYLLSSDMQYDWVNYATALGVDLFLSNISTRIERYFHENVSGNRVLYDIHLYGIKNGVFVKMD